MSFNIFKPAVTLVCNQAVVLCFLLVVETLSSITIDRKWKLFETNMTQVFGGNFTEFTTPSIIACLAFAARSLANLACHKSSRCVFASVFLPRVGGEQTEGFTCWYSQVCNHEGELVRENETVTVADPACSGTRTLICSMQGMIFTDVPPPRTTCTDPFQQHSFGCMYDSHDFKGTYCEAIKYCQELGANLASPKTEQDITDMMAYYDDKHDGLSPPAHFVGLYKVDGVWRWSADQREAGPPKQGNWDEQQPNGGEDEDAGFMFYSATALHFKIGDVSVDSDEHVLCHVWTTV